MHAKAQPRIWLRKPQENKRLLADASGVSLLPYRVGGLMYVPALKEDMAERLRDGAYPGLQSLCLCLEDAVQDSALPEAEAALCGTLKRLAEPGCETEALPLLFVRVRTPEHLRHVRRMLGESESLLTGYVLPKFDRSNAEAYMRVMSSGGWSAGFRSKRLFVMPILESTAVADAAGRAGRLEEIRSVLDAWKDQVLNVRVGGNDLCNLYGVRRSVRQTIYDIGVVRDIMSDIINVFSRDYVVSAPVWEYFGQDPKGEWAQGLRRELELDLLNGFTGKTAIYPTQVPVIHDALRVSRSDLDDALRILSWADTSLGVEKSARGTRMNEVKCHLRWALRIYALGQIYGTRGSEER